MRPFSAMPLLHFFSVFLFSSRAPLLRRIRLRSQRPHDKPCGVFRQEALSGRRGFFEKGLEGRTDREPAGRQAYLESQGFKFLPGAAFIEVKNIVVPGPLVAFPILERNPEGPAF